MAKNVTNDPDEKLFLARKALQKLIAWKEGMINKLTKVPTTIEPIMAIDKGFCISDPISEVNSNGTIAKTVVSEVMIIALNLRLPAV